MKRRKNRRQHVREKGFGFGRCAVETCEHYATKNHHYIPYRMIPSNSFTIQLCDDHHAIADEMTKNIKDVTPLKLFQMMFDFIYGKGAAYRKLEKEEKPKESVFYWNPDVDYSGAD